MASGTIQMPHFEEITVTRVSSKIDATENGVTAARNGDVLYVRGWFKTTSAISANEVLFSLPQDLHILSFSYAVAFSGTGNNPTVGVLAIKEDRNGNARITATSALATNVYWNIATTPVMLSAVFIP